MKINVKLKSGSFLFVDNLALRKNKVQAIETDTLNEAQRKVLLSYASAGLLDSNPSLIEALKIQSKEIKIESKVEVEEIALSNEKATENLESVTTETVKIEATVEEVDDSKTEEVKVEETTKPVRNRRKTNTTK